MFVFGFTFADHFRCWAAYPRYHHFTALRIHAARFLELILNEGIQFLDDQPPKTSPSLKDILYNHFHFQGTIPAARRSLVMWNIIRTL